MSKATKTSLPPVFRRLAWSNLSAQFSEQVALAAAPLAAVLLLGATAADTGYLQAAQTLPFLLFSLPAGVLADRASRRGMMVIAEALRAASLFSTLMLLLVNGLDLPLLALLGAIGAIGTVVYSVAAPALIPTLVERDQLGDANRLLELARSIAFVTGPTVGGAVVGWMGAPTAYVIATGLSATAVVFLRGLPEAERVGQLRRNLLRELREGGVFVLRSPILRPILVTSMFFNLSWFIIQGVFVAYAVRQLGLDASEVGILFGVYGAGMLVGAFGAPWLSSRFPFGITVTVGPAGGLIGSLAVAGTVLYPSGVLAGIGFFFFGLGPIIWTISTTTLRQAVTPGPLLGRISAVIMTASFGTRPIGAALGGLVAGRFGPEACLVLATIGFLVQFVVIAQSSVSRLPTLPEGV